MTRGRPPDYFRAVERAFVTLRGGMAFLTPADWDLVRSWEQRGIPLTAALAGMRAALSRGVPISPRTPLRQCAAAVEEAFDLHRRRSAGAPAAPPAEPAPRERLDRLAESLRAWAPARGAPCRPDMAGNLEVAVRAAGERVAALGLDPDADSRLAAIESDLIQRMKAALPASAQERIAAESARALAAHRARMPAPVYREALSRAIHCRVREAFGVRRLTLLD